MLVLKSYEKSGIILCAREIQKSIDESVYKLITVEIERLGVSHDFDILKNKITNKITGCQFVFHGLQNHTVDSIKSMQGIDIVWVEEASSVTHHSWQILTPTVRNEGSEIWISFNRSRPNDPVWEKFCKNPDDDTHIVEINWYNNKWFPDVLRKEKDRDYKNNFELAEHIWGGKPLNVEGLVYPTFRRDRHLIDPKEAIKMQNRADNLILGLDWGYDHPMGIVRIARQGERYIITAESREREKVINVKWIFSDLVDIAGESSIVVADSARPELIQFVNTGYQEDTNHRHHMKVYGASKGKGSVTHEINTINNLFSSDRLLISEDCVMLIEELETWLWKEGQKNETPYHLGEDLCRAMGYGIMYFENGTPSINMV